MMVLRMSAMLLLLSAVGCIHVDVTHSTVDDDVWAGLNQESIQLNHKLLVVKGSKGIVVCPYLSIEALEATGEAAAIISSPDFDGLPEASVIAVTSKGEALGLKVGMPGKVALDIIR